MPEDIKKLAFQLDKHGRLLEKMFHERLRRKCDNKKKLMEEMERLYDLITTEERLHHKIEESRKLVSTQLAGVAKVMDNFSEELLREGVDLSVQEQQIMRALENIGVPPQSVAINCLEPGRIDIEVAQTNCGSGGQCESIVVPLLSGLLEENVEVKERKCHAFKDGTCVFTLGSMQEYKIDVGVTSIAKDGGLINGDYHKTMELGRGKFGIALSDGMGNGNRAFIESYSTLELIQELLATGLEEREAIKTVNTVLSLRAPDEVFSTVDLAVIDLYSGRGKFVKTGSTPSFIKRRDQVIPIYCNNLPIGILDDIEVDLVTEDLQDGDLLIMMTDGLLDAPQHIEDKEDWFIRMISQFETNDPQEVADLLIERVVRNNGGHIYDDMTVMVSQIEKVRPKWDPIFINQPEPLQRPYRVN